MNSAKDIVNGVGEMSKRKERSNKHAQRVCREIRSSVAQTGGIDWETLSPHFWSWFYNTGEVRMKRPKVRKRHE